MRRKLTALIVGISNYPNGAALKNPINDAEDMSSALEYLGFSVIKIIDASAEDIDRGLESFKDALNSNDVGLFYFAGHGMQIKGENYLNTINTNFIDEISAKHSSIPLNQVIDTMDSCSNSTNIIILDACRNNPFVRAWNRSSDQSGLASVYTPRGTLIAFATSPGEIAKDGVGKNGSYTKAILKHINTQDVSVEDLFKRVRNTLYAITSGNQTSWEHTSLSGDFFFNISVGRSVDIYSPEAIADSLFSLAPTSSIKEAITALKSIDWYVQNPGIEKLSANDFTSGDKDSLFVFGRNIYQAACGNANSATDFISDFRNKTNGVLSGKTKNILDGMLFEVFFNSKGELRKKFKFSKFNELFTLKQFHEYSQSFEFISEVLLTYQNRFYLIPGKSRSISVDIVSNENEDNEHLIKEIHFEGFNIFRENDEAGHSEWGAYPINLEKLKQILAEDMVVPISQLSVTTSFSDDNSKILYPYGMSVKK